MKIDPESVRPEWTTNNPGAFLYWMKTGASELPADWVDDEDSEPTMKTRYYTDNYAVWKFEPGKPPMHRDVEDSEWEESAFPSFEAFEESPGDTHEITADNGGEP